MVNFRTVYSDHSHSDPPRQKTVLECTIERAKDVWGYDYADGLPNGGQIGRRALYSADFGLSDWLFALNMIETRVIGCIIDEECFIVVSGIRITSDSYFLISGFSMELSGMMLPFVPVVNWKQEGDWYVRSLDQAFVITPQSRFRLSINLKTERACNVRMELIGDVIAKRYYLIETPTQLINRVQVDSDLRNRPAVVIRTGDNELDRLRMENARLRAELEKKNEQKVARKIIMDVQE